MNPEWYPVITEHGVKPFTKDRRDRAFDANRYFGAPDLSMLPPNGLGRKVNYIVNQIFSQFCTACATSVASSYQEANRLFSFEWQAAKIGQLSGESIVNGADPRKALGTAVTYGSLPQELAPLTLAKDGDIKCADWNNWNPGLDLKAAPYEKQSIFWITGPDMFNAICQQLVQHQKENMVAIAATRWYVPGDFKGHLKFDPNANTGRHMYLFIDYKIIDHTKYLVLQNSYGIDTGDNGLFYVAQPDVNAAFNEEYTKCAMFYDLDPDTVKRWYLHNLALADILNLPWILKYVFPMVLKYLST